MQKTDTNRTLLVIFITVFLNMLGIGIIIPVIAPMLLDPESPVLAATTGFSQRSIILGFLVAAYPLSQFFGAPVFGSMSDRIGRKKVLIYTLIGSVFGYALFAIGIIYQNIFLLFAGRIIDGLTGGNIAVIYSAISDVSSSKAKTKNFGLVGMAFGLGFIFGPFLGGTLSDPLIVSWFNYSTPFLLAVGLIILNIFLVFRYFPETLIQKSEHEITWRHGLYNVVSAFKLDGIKYILLVIFLITFGFTFFTQFFQVFLIEKFAFRQSDIGHLFAYIGIWIAVSQGLITRFVSGLASSKRVLLISIPALSIVLLLLLLPDNSTKFYYILPFVSIFQGLNQPNLLTVLSNQTGEDRQGEMLGVNQSLQSLALAFPPIIAGFVVSFNINLPILLASICVMCGWLIYVFKFSRYNSAN